MSASPRILLLLETARGFDRGLLTGIARYASLHGPWTFYREPHAYFIRRDRTTLQDLKAWKPTGAVCTCAPSRTYPAAAVADRGR